VKSKRLYILDREGPVRIEASARIGISKGKERQWRFFLEGNQFVSGTKA